MNGPVDYLIAVWIGVGVLACVAIAVWLARRR